MNKRIFDRRLSQLLSDAALQAQFMRSRKLDLEDEQNSFQCVYGIDANVVRYWGNPRDKHFSDKRLGKIFSHDSDELSTAISWGLLTFIFERLSSSNNPLILVPPIDAEVANILQAIHDEDRPLDPDGKKRLDEIQKFIDSHPSFEDLSELNVRLQDIISQEITAAAELRRILLLFTRERIIRLGEAQGKLDNDLFEILFPKNYPLAQWYDYSVAKYGAGDQSNGGWIKLLTNAGKWKTEKLLNNDAQVLSQIEVWNRKLRSAKTRRKWKFLYLTADHRLFRAASEYRPEELKGLSFAEAYLRHPRAFLSEDGVLGAVDDGESRSPRRHSNESVGDWLALLTQPAGATMRELLSYSRANGQAPSILNFVTRMAAARGEGSLQKLVADIEDHWEKFAQGALASYPLESNALDGLTRNLRRSADSLQALLQDAHSQLERERRETLQDYLRVTTRLGRRLEAGQHDKPLLRPVAPIFFEEWREAGRAIATMSKWSDDKVDDERYQKAIELIDRDDNTSYAFYLGNAVFFAARGRWKSAALVAKRAGAIAKSYYEHQRRSNQDARGVHGREAAFFEATCRRQLASDIDGLARARECLAAAETVLRREEAVGKYGDFAEIRFRSERLLQDLFEYCIISFDRRQFYDDVKSLSGISSRIHAILNEVTPDADKALLVNNLESGSRSEITIVVELQMLVATMLLAFLPDAVNVDVDRSKEALHRFFKRRDMRAYEEIKLSSFDLIVIEATNIHKSRINSGREARKRLDRGIQLFTRDDMCHAYEKDLLEYISELTRRV